MRFSEAVEYLKKKHGVIWYRSWVNYPSCVFFYTHSDISDSEKAGMEIAIFNTTTGRLSVYEPLTVKEMSYMNFSDYQDNARKTATYPDTPRIAGLTYVALGLNGEAGEFAEQVKKVIRDDNNVITEERREALKNELGDILWYIANAAWELGYSMERIAEDNVTKLKDRQERGVLHGEGNDR